MVRFIALIFLVLPGVASAQAISSSYATSNGRADTVVMACPSMDGTYTAILCTAPKPAPVTYVAPDASAVATANTAVTVFAAGEVTTGCDFINTATTLLYVDLTNTAVAGSATSIPLQPGQSFHCPYPPVGAVSAVAAQPQAFVAIRY